MKTTREEKKVAVLGLDLVKGSVTLSSSFLKKTAKSNKGTSISGHDALVALITSKLLP